MLISRRHRTLFLWVGAATAGLLSYLSDPDGGLSTLLGGLALLQGVWAIAAAFWARKALMDYPEADQRTLFGIITKSSDDNPGKPIGAGLALIAGSIMFLALVLVFAPRAQASALPAGYLKYGPMLQAEQRHYWPDHPAPWLLAALVEQESCISLRHSRCWSPGARLKTDREEGAGMGQITRAYRADGSLRFDALAGLRQQYGSAMGELSWSSIYQRPDLQLRGIVLMSRDAARPFRDAPAMLALGDACYNGGCSGVKKERRACALTRGCDPGQWFAHVEAHCLKSRQPLYGNRSACDINREHVRNVMLVRAEKYRRAQGEGWEG